MPRPAVVPAAAHGGATRSASGVAEQLPLRGTGSARTPKAHGLRPALLQSRARRPPPADRRDDRAALSAPPPELVPPRYRGGPTRKEHPHVGTGGSHNRNLAIRAESHHPDGCGNRPPATVRQVLGQARQGEPVQPPGSTIAIDKELAMS